MKTTNKRILISLENKGKMLDSFLAEHLRLSRSFIQKEISKKNILINGHFQRSHYLLKESDEIHVSFFEEEKDLSIVPVPMDIKIIYEDDEIIIINKDAGISVHPGAGTKEDTLAAGLLHYTKHLSNLPDKTRRGIVHRLDKDTSGCMVIAKTDEAFLNLKEQFLKRTIKKTYLAIIYGKLERPHLKVDLPIGRHPVNRQKMSVHSLKKSRASLTELFHIENLGRFSLVKAKPMTGRTHQIRVHLCAIKHPILGDKKYSRGRNLPINIEKPVRMMLHAVKLSIQHPKNCNKIDFEAPLANDFKETLESLKLHKDNMLHEYK